MAKQHSSKGGKLRRDCNQTEKPRSARSGGQGRAGVGAAGGKRGGRARLIAGNRFAANQT